MSIQTGEPATEPVRVGTAGIQAADNSDIQYIFGCVELHSGVGAVDIQYETYFKTVGTDLEGNTVTYYTIEYSFFYEGVTPTTDDPVETFPLEPFIPHQDTEGYPITPDYIIVYNKTDPTKRKIGKVNKLDMPVLPYLPPDESTPEPTYAEYQPRAYVMQNAPEANPESLYTCLFVVAKTENPDNKRLGYAEPVTNYVYLTADTSEPSPNGELVSSTCIVPQGDQQIDSVSLFGLSWTPDYTDIKNFWFEEVTSVPGSVQPA